MFKDFILLENGEIFSTGDGTMSYYWALLIKQIYELISWILEQHKKKQNKGQFDNNLEDILLTYVKNMGKQISLFEWFVQYKSFQSLG